jgi:adenylate kinase
VIELSVPEKELIQRLLSRAVSEGRSDDTEEVISRRMEVYRELTAPVMEHYRHAGIHHRIDGQGGIDEVAQIIANIVRSEPC